jgi:hypothetical protein
VEAHGAPPCPRCYCQDEVLWPWAGFRVARALWVAGLCVVVVLAPILASDLLVMTPLTVMFLFAGGPLFSLAKTPPTCRACGLARPTPGWHETPCRPVRSVPSSRLRVRPTPALQPASLQATLPDADAPEQVEPPPPERVDDEQSGVRSLPPARHLER